MRSASFLHAHFEHASFENLGACEVQRPELVAVEGGAAHVAVQVVVVLGVHRQAAAAGKHQRADVEQGTAQAVERAALVHHGAEPSTFCAYQADT